MTVYISDGFSGAFGTTDAFASGSLDPASWTAAAGTWTTASSKVTTTVAASNARATVDPAKADATIYATIKAIAGTNMGLVYRMGSTNTDYGKFQINSTGAWTLSTVGTTAASLASGTNTIVVNDVIKLICNGTAIRVFINDTQIASVTSSTYQTNTKHGLYIDNSTTPSFDTFQVDNPHVVMNVTQTQTRTLTKAITKATTTFSVTNTQTPTIIRATRRTTLLSVTQTQTVATDHVAGIQTTPTGSESTPTYAVKVVDMRGNVSLSATLAEVDRVRWQLNAPDQYDFHFPKGAYTNSQIGVLAAGGSVTEAQIYRNGDLLTWGPMIQLEANGSQGDVKVRGAGVDWYLNRRFVDGPITNMLQNADFESGLTNWTSIGSVTATPDTTLYQTGSKSAKLVSTATLYDHIYQTVSPQPNGEGLLVILSGWFFIETFNGSPGDASFGLFMDGYDTTGDFRGSNYFPVDAARPRKQWIKATTSMWVPPNEQWTFNIRLFAQNGTIYWDDIKCVAMYSLSTQGVGTDYFKPVDLGVIIQQLVSFEQQPYWGKSDLRMGIDSATIGAKQARAYQFVDHMQFDQALREFLDRNDGCDYALRYTPTTRLFKTYHPKRGTDRSGTVTLKYIAGDTTSNCVDYRFSQDGGQCITHQTILGEDNGPDREQGDYTDASQVAGIILEDVRQAPQGTKIGSLQPMAQERVDRYKYVPSTLEMHLKGSTGLVSTLHCGDLVTVRIDDGFTQFNQAMRIMAMDLDCKKNILTVTTAKDTLS